MDELSALLSNGFDDAVANAARGRAAMGTMGAREMGRCMKSEKRGEARGAAGVQCAAGGGAGAMRSGWRRAVLSATCAAARISREEEKRAKCVSRRLPLADSAALHKERAVDPHARFSALPTLPQWPLRPR